MPAFLRVIVVGSVSVRLSALKVASVSPIYFLVEEKPALTLVPASYAITTSSPSCRVAGSVTLMNVSAWIAIILARASRKRESRFIVVSLIGLISLISLISLIGLL